jgi:hypothetical protein
MTHQQPVAGAHVYGDPACISLLLSTAVTNPSGYDDRHALGTGIRLFSDFPAGVLIYWVTTTFGLSASWWS